MKLAKRYGYIIIAEIFSKGITFALIPLYLKNLSLSEYGLMAYYSAIGVVGVITSTLYMESYFSKACAANKGNWKVLGEYYSTFVFTSAVLNLIQGLVLLFLFGSNLIPLYALLSIVGTSLAQTFLSNIVFLQQNFETREASKFGIIYSVTTALSTISLFYFTNLRLEVKFIALIVSAILGNILFYNIHAKKKYLCKLEFDREKTKKALRFSAPLIPSMIGILVIRWSDRLILEKIVSPHELGLYSLAVALAGAAYIAQNGITQIYGVMLARMYADNILESQSRLKRSIFMITAITIVVILVLTLTMEIIINIYKLTEYAKIPSMVLIYSCGYIALGANRMHQSKLIHDEKTAAISIQNFFNSFISIAMLIFLTHNFGIAGSVVAYPVGQILSMYTTQKMLGESFYQIMKSSAVPTVAIILIFAFGLAATKI